MTPLHETIYTYILYASYALYAIVLFGITKFAPQYLEYLKNFIKIYISLLLIIKFNPFVKHSKHLSDFDRKVVFSAGIYLLLTTSIISIVEVVLEKVFKKTVLEKPISTLINEIQPQKSMIA